MNWQHLGQENLSDWMQSQQEMLYGPPDAFELRSPTELAEEVGLALGAFPGEQQVRWTAGGLSILLDDLQTDGDHSVVSAAVNLTEMVDKRKPVLMKNDDDSESGRAVGVRSAVTDEYSLLIDGVSPVGPGGRITYYRTARHVEIAFHLRRSTLGGRWRNPRVVAREALNAFGGQLADGERLRAAFGYYEASGWEVQDLLRPVFVVLVERLRRDDEPRWRLASVHAATDVGDVPPTAGIETVTGCA